MSLHTEIIRWGEFFHAAFTSHLLAGYQHLRDIITVLKPFDPGGVCARVLCGCSRRCRSVQEFSCQDLGLKGTCMDLLERNTLLSKTSGGQRQTLKALQPHSSDC